MRYLLCLLLCLILSSCTKEGNRNGLRSEKSPYLQQHANNPVWWQPWGPKAFKQATQRNRMILLSVGYSTCHWCHVMEKESFKDKEVAKLLNARFIAIKVDREERPDVDAIYMKAVQAMTGSGGWPMTVILTPQGHPVFGATYLPRNQFLRLLTEMSEAWQKEPKKIIAHGKRVADLLGKDAVKRHGAGFSDNVFRAFFRNQRKNFDKKYGGTKGRPKFPPAFDLRVLYRIHRRTGSQNALWMATQTLNALSRGGIYDHLGGGFHRYSTDEKWLVPHFEKMLYDQATLSQAFLEGYQITGNQEYAGIVRETLNYVLREMTGSDGGFFSAQDADSEGEEGKFYVWSFDEIKKHLSTKELIELRADYAISKEGNFEGKNILVQYPSGDRARRTTRAKAALIKLKIHRDKRVPPLTDEKVVTAWNGLMIAAMARAGVVLGEKRYLKAAERAADFLLNNSRNVSGLLLRRWIAGEAKVPGFLDDYAFLIDALIELYQATQNQRWLAVAVDLNSKVDKRFWSAEKSAYFFTAGDDKTLLHRSTRFYDNVRPSGNSMMLLNLLRLADLTLEKRYRDRAVALMAGFPKGVSEHPAAFGYFLMGLDYALDRSKEIAIVGDFRSEATKRMVATLNAPFNPNKVVVVGATDAGPLLAKKTAIGAQPTAYVCERSVCKLPTNDPKKALKLSLRKRSFRLKP